MPHHWKRPKKDPVLELASDLAVASAEAGAFKDFDADALAAYCLELARGILEPDEDEEEGDEEDE